MVAKLTLVGNLGVEPEVRYTADGKPVVTCRVASNYRKRDADSRDWVDATNWYRVTTFGRLAERLSEQLSSGRLAKGTRIIVFGRLEASAYMDRSNQPQPSLDVVADDLLFADNRPRGEGGDFGGGSDLEAAPGSSSPPARSAPPVRRAPPPTDEAADLEDLPF
jgi:single-strand DNA-binding protein